MSSAGTPWYKELTRYHWLVLLVASLGWLLDCMDQQLFNLARRPAMLELLHVRPGDAITRISHEFRCQGVVSQFPNM